MIPSNEETTQRTANTWSKVDEIAKSSIESMRETQGDKVGAFEDYSTEERAQIYAIAEGNKLSQQIEPELVRVKQELERTDLDEDAKNSLRKREQILVTAAANVMGEVKATINTLREGGRLTEGNAIAKEMLSITNNKEVFGSDYVSMAGELASSRIEEGWTPEKAYSEFRALNQDVITNGLFTEAEVDSMFSKAVAVGVAVNELKKTDTVFADAATGGRGYLGYYRQALAAKATDPKEFEKWVGELERFFSGHKQKQNAVKENLEKVKGEIEADYNNYASRTRNPVTFDQWLKDESKKLSAEDVKNTSRNRVDFSTYGVGKQFLLKSFVMSSMRSDLADSQKAAVERHFAWIDNVDKEIANMEVLVKDLLDIPLDDLPSYKPERPKVEQAIPEPEDGTEGISDEELKAADGSQTKSRNLANLLGARKIKM